MADLVNISTPVGVLTWVNISGQGKENYNEDGYEYVASVVMKLSEAQPTIDSIDSVYDTSDPEGKKNKKSTGYRPCNEDGSSLEEGETSDFVIFSFKTGTCYKDGKAKKISVYNSSAAKVDLGDSRVGNGSKGAISGKMRFYSKGKDAGVSLFLNAVQITSFIEYNEDAGFEEVEGDFDGVDDTGFTGVPENKPDKKPTKKPRL